MRSTQSSRRIGPLAALIAAALLLVTACTEPTNDAQTPAPTGSLTPATSTGAPASPLGAISEPAAARPGTP
jgi:hypothetical protein